jgi:hypothetical protein
MIDQNENHSAIYLLKGYNIGTSSEVTPSWVYCLCLTVEMESSDLEQFYSALRLSLKKKKERKKEQKVGKEGKKIVWLSFA